MFSLIIAPLRVCVCVCVWLTLRLDGRHRLWLQYYNSNIDVPHPEPLANLRVSKPAFGVCVTLCKSTDSMHKKAEVAAFERAAGPLAKSMREKVPGAVRKCSLVRTRVCELCGCC